MASAGGVVMSPRPATLPPPRYGANREYRPMIFKKSPPPTKSWFERRDAARREILTSLERHEISDRPAANLLSDMADGLRQHMATTSGLNLTPKIYAPPPPSGPKAALSAVARLIASKTA